MRKLAVRWNDTVANLKWRWQRLRDGPQPYNQLSPKEQAALGRSNTTKMRQSEYEPPKKPTGGNRGPYRGSEC